jgi:hypothetical protein
MPNLDGLQLYKEIRDINKEEYKKVCKSFDEKYFIKKPMALGELAKRVNLG